MDFDTAQARHASVLREHIQSTTPVQYVSSRRMQLLAMIAARLIRGVPNSLNATPGFERIEGLYSMLAMQVLAHPPDSLHQ